MTKAKFVLLISIQYQAENNENKEKYQLGDYKLIQFQILLANITRIVGQKIRRITNRIVGMKRFIGSKSLCSANPWNREFLYLALP